MHCPSYAARKGPSTFACGRPMRTGRSHAVRIVAFRADQYSSHSTYPLSYYELLQLPKAASREAVRKAYETLVKPTLKQASYSSDALFSRAVILKSAAECLLDLELRRSYDQRMLQLKGHAELKVSHEDLPGALALMQEIGQFEAVIQTATSLLEQNPSSTEAPDVAASLALAYWDRAGLALQEPNVLQACEDLEKALALMRRYSISPQLQQQVEHTLQDYVTQHMLELMALPLGPAHAKQRARGLSMLAGITRQPGTHLELPAACTAGDGTASQSSKPGLQAAVEEVLGKARMVMTAQEQVDFVSELQACPVQPSGVAYDTAMALLALGFSGRHAHYIHKADRLLEAIEQQQQQGLPGTSQATVSHGHSEHDENLQGSLHVHGSQSHGGAPSPVAVERATCAMLLGEPDEALRMLGLAPGSMHGSDPGVEAFVKEHSDGSSDLLPGVCLLVKRWMEEALLHSFRESSGSSVDLTAWFEDGLVRFYVKVWGASKASHPALLEVAHFLCCLPDMMQRVLHAVSLAATFIGTKLAAARAAASAKAVATAGNEAATALKQPEGPAAAAAARSMVIGAASMAGVHSPPGSNELEQRLQQEMRQEAWRKGQQQQQQQQWGAAAGATRQQQEEEAVEGWQAGSSYYAAAADDDDDAACSHRGVTASAHDGQDSHHLGRSGTNDFHSSYARSSFEASASTRGAEHQVAAPAARDWAVKHSDEGDEDEEGVVEQPFYKQSSAYSAELRAQLQQMEKAMWDGMDDAGKASAALRIGTLAKVAGLVAVVAIAALMAKDRLMGTSHRSASSAQSFASVISRSG